MTCTESFHTPVPHPSSAVCRVQRAREQLREQLGRLDETELSWQAGVPPERRSDYWLGIIAGSSAWLLWTLDAEEKAKNG